MSLPSRLLGANPSIQVSTLLSGSLSTPSAKQAFVPEAFQLISSTTLVSDQSYIEITNIPATYTHLRLITLLKSTDTSSGGGYGVTRCLVNINTDATNGNYYNGGFQGTNANASGSLTTFSEATRNSFGMGTRANETGFAGNIIDILGYANTSNKKVAKIWSNAIGVNTTYGGQASMFSVFWNNTSAITSIRLLEEATAYGWKTGSSMFLYGLVG